MKHSSGWLRMLAPLAVVSIAVFVARAQTPAPTVKNEPSAVTFYGPPTSSISSGVTVPAGRRLVFTSGTPPTLADPKAAAGARARYGDTKTQGISVLKGIEGQLKSQGLTLADVIYLRVYVAPDRETGKCDFRGWFDAYAQFFGTTANPTKPARSTVGVASLVDSDWLIEVEAVAAAPK